MLHREHSIKYLKVWEATNNGFTERDITTYYEMFPKNALEKSVMARIGPDGIFYQFSHQAYACTFSRM